MEVERPNRFNRAVGTALGVVLLSLTAVYTWLARIYLAEASSRVFIAGAILGGGFFTAIALLIWVRRARSPIAGIAGVVLLAAIISAYPISMWMGRVTYARFGFTIYGVIPVPALDLVVGSGGSLSFRLKTHLFEVDEVSAIATADPETVIVIGTGWQNMALVHPKASELHGVRLVVLPTPEAIVEYNRRKTAGERVALLLHSTC